MSAHAIGDGAFEEFFENAYDPHYIRTLDGARFLRVNRAFEELVGHRRRQGAATGGDPVL